MPCYRPLQAYWTTTTSRKTGRRQITFQAKNGSRPLDLPCGRCIGCLIERTRQWAARIEAEAGLYEKKCFTTLTYSDEYLPADYSLHPEHFTDFVKRLRDRMSPAKIRYFMCGEYGTEHIDGETGEISPARPHYHVCFLGYHPDDLRHGHSAFLDEVWGYGFTYTGELTFASAQYVAKYVLKDDLKHPMEMDADDHLKYPPYVRMSRRPGIGMDYFEQFKGDFLPSDQMVLKNGKVQTVPRAFLRKLPDGERKAIVDARPRAKRQDSYLASRAEKAKKNSQRRRHA